MVSPIGLIGLSGSQRLSDNCSGLIDISKCSRVAGLHFSLRVASGVLFGSGAFGKSRGWA
jgi:hypothetical protein